MAKFWKLPTAFKKRTGHFSAQKFALKNINRQNRITNWKFTMVTEIPNNSVKCRTCGAIFPFAWVKRGQYGACRSIVGCFCSDKCSEVFKLKSTYRYEIQEARQ